MANINVILSFTIQDGDGERTAYPYYTVLPDTTTLAALATVVDDVGGLLDSIIDGAIKKARVVVEVALPGGIKADPVAGSEIERTGLLSYPLVALPGKTYSQDIPTIALATLTGNKINLTNADILAWTTESETGSANPATNDLWSSELATVRTGAKTFRKHRRQTKRT